MPNTTEKRKRRRGALLSALVMGGLMLAFAVSMLLLMVGESSTADAVVAGACAGVFLAIVAGIFIALRQRYKEIDKGEEDEARKY